jgi:plastocyanin
MRTQPSISRRAAFIVLFASVAFGTVACSSGDTGSSGCTSPSEGDVAIADFSYTPSCIAARPGATIGLSNEGEAPHTFTVEGTQVSVDLQAGDHGSADLAGVAPGTYSVICTYHPQMKATLEVG